MRSVLSNLFQKNEYEEFYNNNNNNNNKKQEYVHTKKNIALLIPVEYKFA